MQGSGGCKVIEVFEVARGMEMAGLGRGLRGRVSKGMEGLAKLSKWTGVRRWHARHRRVQSYRRC